MIQQKSTAVFFSIILLFLASFPIRENWQSKPKDGFPLSYYPMFSHKREETYSLRYLVGYDIDNNRYTIPYRYISTGGFNQVRRQINKKCREGQSEELAKKTAERLARCQEEPFNQTVRIDVVKGTYHLEHYFLTANKRPVKEKILSTYAVKP